MERKALQVVAVVAVLVLAGAVCWAAWEVRQLRTVQDDTSALVADCAKHLGQIETLGQLEHDYVLTPLVTGKELEPGARLRWKFKTPQGE